MRRVYTIGDCALDVFFEQNKPIEAKPGGSFLNSSVSLGRLGVSVSLISEIGIDKVGQIIEQFLLANQVDVSNISHFKDSNSNLALAFLDENKNAEYSFYKTRKNLPETIVFPTNVKKDDIILFGSFLAIKKEFQISLNNFLNESRNKGALLIYDPNFRTSHLPLLHEVLPFIKKNMELAHVVKASNEDFSLICGMENFHSSHQWLKSFSDAILIYTANKDGIFIHHENQEYYMEVPQIFPVSTVGAGDSVNAAIAYFMIRNKIGVSDLNKLSEKTIRELAEIAISFSQEVCMFFENSLPVDFALKYRL